MDQKVSGILRAYSSLGPVSLEQAIVTGASSLPVLCFLTDPLHRVCEDQRVFRTLRAHSSLCSVTLEQAIATGVSSLPVLYFSRILRIEYVPEYSEDPELKETLGSGGICRPQTNERDSV